MGLGFKFGNMQSKRIMTHVVTSAEEQISQTNQDQSSNSLLLLVFTFTLHLTTRCTQVCAERLFIKQVISSVLHHLCVSANLHAT